MFDYKYKINKRILKWTGYVLTFLSVFLLIDVFFENIQVLQLPKLTIWLVPIGIIGFIIILAGHSLLTYTWFLQLKWKHPNLNFLTLFVVIGLSQIAKYVPGNVAHLVGRAFLIRRVVPATEVAITLIVESLILSLSALFFAGMWWLNYIIPEQISWKNSVYFAVILIIISPVMIKLARVKMGVDYLSFRTFFLMLGANSISFIIHGLLIFLIAENVINIEQSVSVFQYVCAFSMAFLVGYLLPGAPGGVGIREYAFVLLMSASVGQFNALQIIIIHRLLTIAGDLLLWSIARHHKRQLEILN